MLEDQFNDIIRKSIIGLGLSASELGIPSAQLERLLAGTMEEATPRVLAEIAKPLQLDADKLISLASYMPLVSPPSILHTFVSPYGHLGVNAFVIETSDHLLVFDTGTDSSELLHFIATHPAKSAQLFITHEDHDHVAGVSEFTQRNIKITYPREIQSSHQQNQYQFAGLQITHLDVAGHYTPASAYFIESPMLSQPLCIVGDSLFAGSIGGCKTQASYALALSNIKKNLFTLKADTIVCPGHGPLTTLEQELNHNPFFSM